MKRYVLLAAAFCAAASQSTLVRAENISTAKTLGLVTAFTLCGDSGGGKTCSSDTWTIKVLPDGWELQAASVIGDSVTNWSERCSQGQYSFQGAGVAWGGTCRLSDDSRVPDDPKATGDAKAFCFHTDLKTRPKPTMAALTDQCFAVTGDRCTMKLTGISTMLAQDGTSVLGRFSTYSEAVTECRVSGAAN